jgi:hypothetical protein
MEPQLKTVKNYYLEKSKNNLRIKEFDTTNSMKLSRDIQDLVKMQVEVTEEVHRDKLVIHGNKDVTNRLAYFEYIIDKKYKELVAFYLAKGLKANFQYFSAYEHNRSDKAGLKFKDLLDKARSETESAIKEDKKLNHPIRRNITSEKFRDSINLTINQLDRSESNNEYMDNENYHFKTRRDYPINRVLLTRNRSHMTYFHMYKEGVVEGYKDRQQMLGGLDASLDYLKLSKSREELIKKIALLLTKSE